MFGRIWRGQRGIRVGVLSGILVALVCWSMGTPLSADTPAGNRREAEELVLVALSLEPYGCDSDRQKLLDRAVGLAPEQPSAHWHNGEIRVGDQWLPASGPIESPNEKRLRQRYEQRRAGTEDTVEGQLALADWCAEHRLRAQETAHLHRILQLAPDHAAVRERLQYERINGRWVQRQDLWRGLRQDRQIDESLKNWQESLDGLLTSLRRGSPARTELIVDRIKAELTPGAVPALEIVLGNHSESAALIQVQLLGYIPHHDAAASLARQAVLSPWPAVCTAALEQLRNRPRDHYVPLWLSELSTPIESRIQTEVTNGRIFYRHELTRETQTQRTTTLLDTVLDRKPSLVRMPAGNNALIGPAALARARMAIGMAQSETRARALSDAQLTAYGREVERVRQNQRIEAMNDQLYGALAATTGESLGRTPQAWWSWWDEENGMVLSGDKQVDYRYSQNVRMYQDVNAPALSGGDGFSGQGSTSGFVRAGANLAPGWFGWDECFVAGTPVWTIAGAVSIETIRVGDLVLSQDPNTGELAYQPVLETSKRPPEPLVKVRLVADNDDTLEGSGGHPMWVSGDGWVKLWDLRPGMVIHGVGGASVISDVESGSTQETFNLVVDNFHTYLVGDRRLLCHDNTPLRPTSAVVPGLIAD